MRIDLTKEEFLRLPRSAEGGFSVDTLSQKTISINELLRKPPIGPIFSHPFIPQIQTSSEETIWRILCQSKICKSDPSDLDRETVSDCKRKISVFIKNGEPIRMIFIAFPFKCHHNPLKTNRRLPDAGELAFIRRLLEIDANIKTIYLPGIKWTVLSEGEAYNELFNVSLKEAANYLKRIKEFIELLKANQIVEIDSLDRVCRNFPDFQKEYDRFFRELFDKYKTYQTLPSEFQPIYWTMWHSQDIRNLTNEEIFFLYTDSTEKRSKSLRDQIANQALEFTLRYLAYNQAKNQVRAIQKSFLGYLYVAITSKPGKYAFHPISSQSKFFPHHGVPLLIGKKKGFVKIIFLVDILSRPERFQSFYLKEDLEDKPFYYRETGIPSLLSVSWDWG